MHKLIGCSVAIVAIACGIAAWHFLFQPAESWLYAISKEGENIWTRQIAHVTGQIFDVDGRICIETSFGMICYNNNGDRVDAPAIIRSDPMSKAESQRSESSIELRAFALPAVNPFEGCVVNSTDCEVAAYRGSELLWRLDSPTQFKFSEVVFTATGNTILRWSHVGNELKDKMWIIDAHGYELKHVAGDVIHFFSTQPDGSMFYFLADAGELVKLSASAEVLWVCETDTTLFSSMPQLVVAPDGMLYIFHY